MWKQSVQTTRTVFNYRIFSQPVAVTSSLLLLLVMVCVKTILNTLAACFKLVWLTQVTAISTVCKIGYICHWVPVLCVPGSLRLRFCVCNFYATFFTTVCNFVVTFMLLFSPTFFPNFFEKILQLIFSNLLCYFFCNFVVTFIQLFPPTFPPNFFEKILQLFFSNLFCNFFATFCCPKKSCRKVATKVSNVAKKDRLFRLALVFCFVWAVRRWVL